MSAAPRQFALPDLQQRTGHWLLTSAAAKVDLTQRMRAAINQAGCQLFATDCDVHAAALHVADDRFVLPPMDTAGFLDAFIAACRQRGISIILPTRDADLLFFARHREQLAAAGLWVLVSDCETIEICRDKIRFHAHCLLHGLPVLPRLQAPFDYPCFVRPRIGSAGIGAARIDGPDAMRAGYGAAPRSDDFLVQPLCADPEYTIDALFGPDGMPVQWIARARLKVRAGESVVARTVEIPALDALVRQAAASLHLFGPITLQAFYSPAHGPHLIEINPRFGGACALGIEAGLDSPSRVFALVQGDLDAFSRPRPLQAGLMMMRYSQDLFVREEGL